jgi:hypothetical protein
VIRIGLAVTIKMANWAFPGPIAATARAASMDKQASLMAIKLRERSLHLQLS